MICPVCNGRGEVRKHFLWIFRWLGRCRKCGGTGWLEDGDSRGRRTPAVVAGRRESFREWADDDRSRWLSRESSSGRDESFVPGSGGRSGGGGGGSAWEDASSAAARAQIDLEHPVIVDPFVGDAAAVATTDVASGEINAEAPDGAASSDYSSSEDSGSSEGTSY